MNANRKANLWTTGLISVVVAILIWIGTASCSALGIGQGWSAVDPDALPPDVAAHALPTEVPIPATDPERNYVIVPDADVPDGVASIDLDEVPEAPGAEGWEGALGGALAALGPWGALGGALLAKLLATKRGRHNGAQAFRALAKARPLEAAKSVLKADGWMHTEEGQKPPPV